jgi:hypothetical protein
MKPCNITSRSLIIAWLSESNKTTAQIYSVQYLISVCIITYFLAVAYIWVYKPKKIKVKECIHVTIHFILVFGQNGIT